MHSRIMCHRKPRNCDREMRAKMAVGQWHGRVRTWAVGGQATQALTCLCAGSAGCDCSTCVWAEAQGQVGEDRLQGKREQWGCWSTLTCDTGQRICLTECSENPTHQFQQSTENRTWHRAQLTSLSYSFPLLLKRHFGLSSLGGRGF